MKLTRRDFVKMAAGAGIGMLALGGFGIQKDVLAQLKPNENVSNLAKIPRRVKAYNRRRKAAKLEKKRPRPSHLTNGDEQLYANKIGNYSKALPHNDLGEVDLPAYESLIAALTTGNPQDFESIQLGGAVKLVNPQAAYAFELIGPDSHHLGMIVPPTFSSAEEGSEMGEVYWQALARDIPFSEYSTDMLIAQAADDLSSFSDFRGPKEVSNVTPRTIFRGNTLGDLVGPYISQFLWKDIPYGAIT
ncbi:MAG: twin-arginine translocation signal domain-containing protein, partial [Nitrososphaerales archaeon]